MLAMITTTEVSTVRGEPRTPMHHVMIMVSSAAFGPWRYRLV